MVNKLIGKTKSWWKLFHPGEAPPFFIFGPADDRLVADAGISLFRADPVFRDAVAEIDRLLQAQGEARILPYFQGSAITTGDPARPWLLLSLQLALTDLFRSRGILPTAVMGIGAGEVAALYAADSITREAAVRLQAAYLLAARRPSATFDSFLLPTRTPADLPSIPDADLHLVADLGPGGVVILCETAAWPACRSHLDQAGIPWQSTGTRHPLPLHTPLLLAHPTPVREALVDIVPRPLGFDYHSPTLGRMVPAHTPAPPHLLAELPYTPVHLHRTLREMRAMSRHTVLHFHSGELMAGLPSTFVSETWPSSDHLHLLSDGGPTPDAVIRRLKGRKQAADSPPPTAEQRYRSFLAQLDLMTPATAGSPQAVNAFLRQHGDVHFLPRNNCWLVLGYPLVRQVLKDHQTFSNSPYLPLDALLTGADPPEHRMVRSFVQPHFSPKALQPATEQAEQEIDSRLRLLASQPRFDVVGDFSVPVAQLTMGRFLGMEPADVKALQALHPPPNIYEHDALDDVKAFFRSYLHHNRNAPQETGMAGVLRKAVDTGDIPLEGAADLMKVFWVAGIMTVVLHLTRLVQQLLLHPDIARQLRTNPASIPDFIAESLRLHPSAVHIMRHCTRDTTLGGHLIPAGSLLLIGMLSANRDPAMFERPDDLLLGRPPGHDVAFGGGIHYCLGHHLARKEAQAVVTRLLPLLDRLEPDPATPVKRHFRMDLFGPVYLPVRWKGRPAGNTAP